MRPETPAVMTVTVKAAAMNGDITLSVVRNGHISNVLEETLADHVGMNLVAMLYVDTPGSHPKRRETNVTNTATGLLTAVLRIMVGNGNNLVRVNPGGRELNYFFA